MIAIGLEGLQGKKAFQIEEEKQDDPAGNDCDNRELRNLNPAGRPDCGHLMCHGPGIMGTPVLTVNVVEFETVGEGEEATQLLQRAGVEIAIHIDAAERPFNGVDPAVLIAVQLL